MAFLVASLCLRLGLALWPLVRPRFNSAAPKISRAKALHFCWGVVVCLVEPLSGIDIIEETFQRFDSEAAIAAQIRKEGLITESEYSTRDADKIKKGKARVAELRQAQHASVYAAAETRKRISLVMLFLEDIPELLIDVLFIVRLGGSVDNVALFALTTALTGLHMLRVGSELVFQFVNMKHIPQALHIRSQDELDCAYDTRAENAHAFAYVKVAADLAKKSKGRVTDLVIYWMQHSQTLGEVDLDGCVLGDEAGVKIFGAMKSGGSALRAIKYASLAQAPSMSACVGPLN